MVSIKVNRFTSVLNCMILFMTDKLLVMVMFQGKS